MKSSLCVLLTCACLLPCAAQAKHHAPRQIKPQAAPRPPANQHPSTDQPFPDVPKDHWAAAAVETLRRRGIVKGYPSSK